MSLPIDNYRGKFREGSIITEDTDPKDVMLHYIGNCSREFKEGFDQQVKDFAAIASRFIIPAFMVRGPNPKTREYADAITLKEEAFPKIPKPIMDEIESNI
tara:strand:+ start:4732 stop:5034 length:303 start_codon:yes stop_codon:yes gene_type:complete